MPYCSRDPKGDHNFDNHPYEERESLHKHQGLLQSAATVSQLIPGAVRACVQGSGFGGHGFRVQGSGFRIYKEVSENRGP